MNRLLAGGALCLCAALLPHLSSAQETALDNHAPAIVVPQFDRAQTPTLHWLRPALYALQAIDSIETAAALRKPYRSETNPMMRPFTHGGVATIAFGFALGDWSRDRLFRRASHAQRQSLDGMQAMSNIDGIVMTTHSLHAP